MQGGEHGKGHCSNSHRVRPAEDSADATAAAGISAAFASVIMPTTQREPWLDRTSRLPCGGRRHAFSQAMRDLTQRIVNVNRHPFSFLSQTKRSIMPLDQPARDR